jgi:hypothetical protein
LHLNRDLGAAIQISPAVKGCFAFGSRSTDASNAERAQ